LKTRFFWGGSEERIDWAQKHQFGAHENACELAYSKIQAPGENPRLSVFSGPGWWLVDARFSVPTKVQPGLLDVVG